VTTLTIHAPCPPVNGTETTALREPLVTKTTTGAAARASLPGHPASVQTARQFVRDALTGCPRVDDLVQAADELASNAVNWSAAGEDGTFTVTVRTASRWARVEVTDPGPATAPASESNGWGLDIVRAITDRAGDGHGPGASHTAWAEVTWPAAGTPDGRQRA
jgi:anti-sigma regulatory factor (Ser/Thr protein kinase)